VRGHAKADKRRPNVNGYSCADAVIMEWAGLGRGDRPSSGRPAATP